MKPRPFAVHQVERRRHRLRACRAARARATRRSSPATTVVTPWLTFGAMVGRREHQPVVVRVRVDEAGAAILPGGVDLDLAFLR